MSCTVSGDLIVRLVGRAMSDVVAAVEVAQRALPDRPVIVGGLAVVCRLSNPDRATTDLDIVDRGNGPAFLELLRQVEGADPAEPSAVMLPTANGTVKVDVLSVNQAELDRLSDDPGDRLFAQAHAWAYESATPVTIESSDPGAPPVTVSAWVSEPGPLVAIKLQAIENRPDDKAGTDLRDVIRLVLSRETLTAVTTQLSTLPSQMQADVLAFSQKWFLDKASSSLHLIRMSGGREVSDDDLLLVHELLEAACVPASNFRLRR